MPSRRRSPRRDSLQQHSKDLGDRTRNERQKAMLLREVSELRCKEIGEAIEHGKKIIAQSEKLCDEKPRRKRAM